MMSPSTLSDLRTKNERMVFDLASKRIIHRPVKRAQYGFQLEFPPSFTIEELQQITGVRYITLYVRVKRALQDGELIKSGEKTSIARGRRSTIYRRVQPVNELKRFITP